MVTVIKEAFTVIGKEGSTLDGEGFIQKLWQDANAHFDEVAPLARKAQAGRLWEFGAPCPIFLAPFNRGKMAFAKACIWRA